MPCVLTENVGLKYACLNIWWRIFFYL